MPHKEVNHFIERGPERLNSWMLCVFSSNATTTTHLGVWHHALRPQDTAQLDHLWHHVWCS